MRILWLVIGLLLTGVVFAATDGELTSIFLDPRTNARDVLLTGATTQFTAVPAGGVMAVFHAPQLALNVLLPQVDAPKSLTLTSPDDPAVKCEIPFATQARFGPATLTNRHITWSIDGLYTVNADHTAKLQLRAAPVLAGSCVFGKLTAKVLLIDANLNGAFGDRGSVLTNGAEAWGYTPGDRLAVDTGAGDFATFVKSAYGQPLQLNGAWYDVTFADGAFTAKPLALKAGTLTIDHAAWAGVLIGKQYQFCLFGDAKPIALPADQYTLVYFSDSPLFTMPVAISNLRRPCAVAPGKTTAASIDTRVTATCDAAVENRVITVNLTLKDAVGNTLEADALATGKYGTKAPKFVILDHTGKAVQTGEITTTVNEQPGGG